MGRPKLEFNAAEPPNDKDSRFVLEPPDATPLLPLLLLAAIVPLLLLVLPLFVVDPAVGRDDDEEDDEDDDDGAGAFAPPVVPVPLLVVPVAEPDSEFPMLLL